jgi:hypothetical protein
MAIQIKRKDVENSFDHGVFFFADNMQSCSLTKNAFHTEGTSIEHKLLNDEDAFRQKM